MTEQLYLGLLGRPYALNYPIPSACVLCSHPPHPHPSVQATTPCPRTLAAGPGNPWQGELTFVSLAPCDTTSHLTRARVHRLTGCGGKSMGFDVWQTSVGPNSGPQVT